MAQHLDRAHLGRGRCLRQTEEALFQIATRADDVQIEQIHLIVLVVAIARLVDEDARRHRRHGLPAVLPATERRHDVGGNDRRHLLAALAVEARGTLPQLLEVPLDRAANLAML